MLNMKWAKKDDVVIKIPKSQTAKYNVLLCFYRKILRKIPGINKELNKLYRNCVEENYTEINKYTNAESVVQMDATELLFKMTADEIEM